VVRPAPAASRWAPAPDHVRPVDGVPLGFRYAGVAAQIKPSGGLDVGLVVADGGVSAMRFTRSGTAAPPVLVSQERTRPAAVRAVVVNAGNANAATGPQGGQDALAMQAAAARALGLDADEVAVCSTGVIGVPLPMERVHAGIEASSRSAPPSRWRSTRAPSGSPPSARARG
jgi:glutamate N-acetyltransferase/amino-acid N-acetyltransferase